MSHHISLLTRLWGQAGLLRSHRATNRSSWMRVTLLVVLSLLIQSSAQATALSVVPAAGVPDPAPKTIGYSLEDATADSNIVYVCSRSSIGRTNDISAQSPDWTNITPPAVGTLSDCVPDPWKPQEKMWAVSSSGIWKGENLNTTIPLWTQPQTTEQIRSATDGFTQNGSEPDRIIASMSIPGTVFVLYSHGGLGSAPKTWVGRSTDDGFTWSWSKVADEGEQARDFGFAILQDASSPDAVTIWATAKRGHLYTSMDGGKTFTQNLQLPPSNFYQLHSIYSPVADTDGSILYVGDGSASTGTAYIYRTLDGGDTWTNISPVDGDSQPRGPFRQYEITGPPTSSTHLYALVQRPQDVVHENKKLYYSADGGASWTLRYDFAAWPFDILGIGLSTIDEDGLYVLRQDLNGAVSNTLIYSSNDGGTTWSEKSGNWKANVGNWTGAVAVWDASTSFISGKVTTADGNPLPGTTISYGMGRTVTTDDSGFYIITDLSAGSYTLVPSKRGFAFTPPFSTWAVPPSRTDVDFVGSPVYSISGRVTYRNTDIPIPGVKIEYWGPSGESFVTTDSDGFYSITDLSPGIYEPIPVMERVFFEPEPHGIRVPPSQSDVDFTGSHTLRLGSKVHGFDPCVAPPIKPPNDKMRVWKDSSPYRFIGIYIGRGRREGDPIESRACAQDELENTDGNPKAWISQAAKQRWWFVPIWASYQAPVGCATKKYHRQLPWDASQAWDIGQEDAQLAVDKAYELGLVGESKAGTIIYLDIERYDELDEKCEAVVEAYIKGWVSKLHASGNLAGAYGHRENVRAWWVSTLKSELDATWVASYYTVPDEKGRERWYYDPKADPYNYPPSYETEIESYPSIIFPRAIWEEYRLRQYNNTHAETWGGAKIKSMDSDVADGIVATAPLGQDASLLPSAPLITSSSIMSSPTESSSFLIDDMDLLSPSEGWILVNNRVLWTTSGGDNWMDITPPTPTAQSILSVYFLDTSNGWVMSAQTNASTDGEDLLIYSTNDGGRTWQTYPFDAFVSNEPTGNAQIHFVDPLTGWVVIKLPSGSNFSYGQLFKTSDGGANWTELTIPSGNPVNFVTPERGWTVEGPAGNHLYMTQDGGATWVLQDVVSADSISGYLLYNLPTFESPQNGVLPIIINDRTQTQVKFYITHDGGNSWDLTDSVNINEYVMPGGEYPISVIDSSHWVLADPISLPHLPAYLSALDFVTTDLGWVYTSTGSCTPEIQTQDPSQVSEIIRCDYQRSLLKTSDGGQTWSEIQLPSNDVQPRLTVIKHMVNDDGGIASATDFTMMVTGSNVSPASFPGNENGKTVTLDAGDYKVSETGPSGYAISFSADCTGAIALGETKTCTITNDDIPPRLVVIKHVINDNGGTATANDFTMNVTGTNVSPASFPGDENGTTVVLDAGSYSVSETGTSGYAISLSGDCSGTVALGETKSCTVTNDDIQPRLVVIKHVVNDNGGTATAADFTMNVSGANVDPTSFPGDQNGTTVTLNAGNYEVSETDPNGYTASLSTECSGVIAFGETKTCIITNDDIQFVDIDIVPHSKYNRIHFHRKHGPLGLIQVAILSTSDFDAPSMVDRTSLTFGRTGDEESLMFCFDHARDVNRDGLKDLICVFRGRLTGFQVGDTTGILKGTTVDGARIEGSDSVKIVISGEHEEEEDE